MQKLVDYFSLIIGKSTPFIQKLNQSSLMTQVPAIQMTDILFLIECFEGYGPECNGIYLTGQEYLQQFFKVICLKPLCGVMAIKMTLTIHLILYEFQIGEIVAEEMISGDNKINIVLSQSHGQFSQNYLMYLQKLAQNLKLFYSCKIGQYPVFEQEITSTYYTESTRENQINQFNIFKKQNNFKDTNIQYREYQQKKLEAHFTQNNGFITIEQKIIYLFKVHNLLNQCTQILNLATNILSQIGKNEMKNLYIEICCVLWNDTMVMYKFTSQELCKLLDSFRFLPLQQILSIQQIFWANTNATKSIKWIYNNRKYFDHQNIVKEPFWFEDNPKLLQEIKNCIIDYKMNSIPETCRQMKLQTPQNNYPKSPISINQPYSGRISQKNPQFFLANKKIVQNTIEQSQTKEQKQQTQKTKNIVSPIFQEDDELELSQKQK